MGDGTPGEETFARRDANSGPDRGPMVAAEGADQSGKEEEPAALPRALRDADAATTLLSTSAGLSVLKMMAGRRTTRSRPAKKKPPQQTL